MTKRMIIDSGNDARILYLVKPKILTGIEMLFVMILVISLGSVSPGWADSTQVAIEETGPVGPVEGYRGKPYKAPTPWTAPGATTLYFADEVEDLVTSSDVVLINVSPITLSPKDRDGNRQWIVRKDKAMHHIPESKWLPNVGYQELDEEMSLYFQRNLDRFTESNKYRGILFYCTADCWMSWNAVKRAATEYGYTNTYWYPYGIDGWKEVGLRLEPAEPEPFSDFSS